MLVLAASMSHSGQAGTKQDEDADRPGYRPDPASRWEGKWVPVSLRAFSVIRLACDTPSPTGGLSPLLIEHGRHFLSYYAVVAAGSDIGSA